MFQFKQCEQGAGQTPKKWTMWYSKSKKMKEVMKKVMFQVKQGEQSYGPSCKAIPDHISGISSYCKRYRIFEETCCHKHLHSKGVVYMFM